ncbi:hypothetical protein VTK56DRAFT_2298 [Thermocarpiscus australiensis]
MTVHAYTLHPRPTPESRRDRGWTPPGLGDPDGVLPSKWFCGGTTADLHAFLASGLDLLVVATPLTSQTRHLLAEPEFRVLGTAGKGGADLHLEHRPRPRPQHRRPGRGAGQRADPRRGARRDRSGAAARGPPALEGQEPDHHAPCVRGVDAVL